MERDPGAAALTHAALPRPRAPEEAAPSGLDQVVQQVLADPDRLTLVFQPLVALEHGTVAGYEALSRFEGPGARPDLVFAEADRLGVGAELEAVAVARCLDVRTTLPPDCFLTVNVSPHLVVRPPLRDLLLGTADLAPLVLELTEHQQVDQLDEVLRLREAVRARGGLWALDDAGAGYSGLQALVQLRPDLVKLDRSLVQDAAEDEAKLAMAEALGGLAGRLDAWLLAEGVETWSELEAFLRLGVPLAQGYLLGRPAPPWAGLSEELATRIRRARLQAVLAENVAGLVEEVPREVDAAAGRTALRLDDWGRPVAVLLPRLADDREQGHRVVETTMRVRASEGVEDVARRAMTRRLEERFAPIPVVDAEGRSLGVVRVERLVVRLAALKDR